MSDRLATAYPDETLRDVANRMAEHGVTRMPVIARGQGREIVGITTLPAMLAGRLRDLQDERDSERVLRVARPRQDWGRPRGRAAAPAEGRLGSRPWHRAAGYQPRAVG
jgi:chloride channel protein, CIC family